MARVGLLGGTFNPPHIAHLVCAMEARDQLGLDVVRLIPAAIPPHKEVPGDPGVEVRLELCRLAAAAEPGLEVSRAEADRPGPSYTVDTLRALHDESPGDDLTFIVGGDMAYALPEWREPEVVLGLARLAVGEREGVRRADILERLAGAGLPGIPERIEFFEMPRLDVSSSQLRRRVAAGRPIRHLVPAAVADRIASLGLYRVEAWA
ncbi:MAG: nicotinate-nucleotide adenylyltransferase [Solirubrobacteraceae bacterium]|nr:nicotinate-nucleotide adenylyltransferase [Solirubrobacteraceae bacterium]